MPGGEQEQADAEHAENRRTTPDDTLPRERGDRTEGDRDLQQRDTVGKPMMALEQFVGLARLLVALMFFLARSAFDVLLLRSVSLDRLLDVAISFLRAGEPSTKSA